MPSKKNQPPLELPPSVSHGSLEGWLAGCRCIECFKAKQRAYMRQRRDSKLPPEAPKAEPHEAYEHGTRSRYVHDGCRCRACRKANADYQRQYMFLFNRRPSGITITDILEEHYTRVATAQGTVAHYVTNGEVHEGTSACGRYYYRGWHGTGSQGEVERVSALPTCLKCVKTIRTAYGLERQ